jgi:hypothetical protein
MLMMHWIGQVLERVAERCGAFGEPSLTSLCVHQNGTIGARAHGIGVVTFGDPSDYQTWEELEEAQRVEPDPERLDEFIRVRLSSDTRHRLSRRLH